MRSYLYMRLLDYTQLGTVALVQALILLVGIAQLGVLNGRYRLLCGESGAGARGINDFTWSFIGLAGAVSLAATALFLTAAPRAGYGAIAYIGVVAGVLTLLRSWVSNVMIAHASLRQLNLVNLGSALAVLVLAPRNPLLYCLLSLLLQPLLFVAGALWSDPALLPRAFSLRAALWRSTLASGFVVFLTSVFQLLNGQMERWFIVSWEGTTALGHYYLALLFINLYAMIPTPLFSIYLPVLVRQHQAAQHGELRHALRRFRQVTLLYSLGVVIVTLLLARPLLGWVLPGYLGDLQYVFLLLPGLVLFGLTAPFAMVFNVLIQYRFYLLAFGCGTVLTGALLLAIGYAYGNADLRALSPAKSAVYVCMGVVIVVGYQLICRARPEFRLRQP